MNALSKIRSHCRIGSEFSFELFESTSAIPSEQWNSVVKFGSEFMQIPYLDILEKEHPENMHFHYSIIYKSQKPIAIAYFQVVDFYSENFENVFNQEIEESICVVKDYFKKHFTNHLIRSADKANIRILICGNTFISGEHGFVCLPEINKKEVFDAFEEVIDNISTIEKLRGKISVVLIKDFYSSEKSTSNELKEFKFHDFMAEPNMIVDINWNTFEEYLNGMSKKYRNRTKSVMKVGAEIEQKDFSVSDILKNSERIQELYDSVHLKAKFNLAVLSSNYFVEMKKVMKDKFAFTAYYYDNKMIGFRTSFTLKNSTEAHFIGLDYELNKELKLYQNILYDYLKEAIGSGSKQLFLGRTASEIKSTIGAEAHQLICYIRHENPLSNHFIKPIINSLKPTSWIPRNPFKEEIALG